MANGTEGPEGAAKAVADSKKLLARGSALTQSVEGNPTSSFAPPKEEKPKIPQVHSSAAKASYSLAHKPEEKAIPGGNPNMSEELNARKEMEKGAL